MCFLAWEFFSFLKIGPLTPTVLPLPPKSHRNPIRKASAKRSLICRYKFYKLNANIPFVLPMINNMSREFACKCFATSSQRPCNVLELHLDHHKLRYSITFLNRTPMFDCCVVWWGSKNKNHKKDTCLKEIGLHFQIYERWGAFVSLVVVGVSS